MCCGPWFTMSLQVPSLRKAFYNMYRSWVIEVAAWTAKETEGQLARWLDILTEYDHTILCRPGVQHRKADALSRRPCGKGCVCATLEDKVQVSDGVQPAGEPACVS